MTAVPQINMAQKRGQKSGEVLLGEDWVSPESMADTTLRDGRKRRGLVSLNHSPLARKIIIFNLMALVILVAGVLFMNPFRDSLVQQRELAMQSEARLIASFFESNIPDGLLVTETNALQISQRLGDMKMDLGTEVFLFDANGNVISTAVGTVARETASQERSTIITDFLNMIWEGISGIMTSGGGSKAKVTSAEMAQKLFVQAHSGEMANSLVRAPTAARSSRWPPRSSTMASCKAWSR